MLTHRCGGWRRVWQWREYVVVVVLASFRVRWVTWFYDFVCPPKQRGWRTMPVVAAEAKRKLVKIVRKFNKERINE